MDFIFYRSPAINGFDSFGHYLRAGADRQPVLELRGRAGAGLLGELPGARSARRDGRRRRGAADRDVARRCRRSRAAAAAPRARARRRPPALVAAPHARAPRRTSAADAARRRCSTTCSGATADARARRAIAGNPVLIGAATVLVVIVAVFLSYNANQGLPFVPDLRAQGARRRARAEPRARQRGADRRRAGRLGRLDHRPSGRPDGTQHRRARPQARARRRAAAARLDDHRPAALGARPQVRRDHARARRSEGFDDGDTIPLAPRTPPPVEFDEFLDMFDEPTRAAVAGQPARASATRFAGRGDGLNQAIGALRPLLRDVIPVARNLASRGHGPRRASSPSSADAARIVAPGRRARRPSCSSTSTRTFARAARGARRSSRSRSPRARRRSTPAIRDVPAASGRSWPTPRACSASCARACARCARAAPTLADALEVGTPTLRAHAAVQRAARVAARGGRRASPRTRSSRAASSA